MQVLANVSMPTALLIANKLKIFHKNMVFESFDIKAFIKKPHRKKQFAPYSIIMRE